MTYEYGKPPIRVYMGNQLLFPGGDSEWEKSWEPLEPDGSATLWRYMSYAKFCSLLENRALFFSLVADMVDKYEGFVYPPEPREHGDRLQEVEHNVRDLLQVIALTSLISCWTKSDHESSLMWDAYAGAEGVAVRTTFQDLQSAIRSIQPELPVTFGQIKYVNFRQQEVPRFGWAPLFHKRIEYRGEDEVRAVLPGPPIKGPQSGKQIGLDPDVDEQRGRYIPVSLGILVKGVVLSPHAPSGFDQLVKSAVRRAGMTVHVTPSALTLPPMSLREGIPDT